MSPTVTTQAVTLIGTTTATGNGNVTALGIPNPTQHGVAWGTSSILQSRVATHQRGSGERDRRIYERHLRSYARHFVSRQSLCDQYRRALPTVET